MDSLIEFRNMALKSAVLIQSHVQFALNIFKIDENCREIYS